MKALYFKTYSILSKPGEYVPNKGKDRFAIVQKVIMMVKKYTVQSVSSNGVFLNMTFVWELQAILLGE